MNRRDFLKTGIAASAAMALPVIGEATEKTKPLQMWLIPDTNRTKRYQEYKDILNNNFELNNKIRDIAGEAAKRVGEFPSDDMLSINDILNSKTKFGEQPFICDRSSRHRYLRNLYRAYNLAVHGDGFYELVYDADYPDAYYGIPRRPILSQELPADTVYRIETVNGELVEYQQSKTGVDYAALSQPLEGTDPRLTVVDYAALSQPLEGTDPRLMLINKSTAIRFRPNQIYHLKIGSSIFQPYGESLLEPIRKNPAANIEESAIENFFTVFEKGMQDLKDLCK